MSEGARRRRSRALIGAAGIVCVWASGCAEDIQLVAPAAPECELCASDGVCSPAPDGSACSAGSCVAGECVADDGCPTDERFVAVAAGDTHTCALAFDGALYCWGLNVDGQLGLGDFAPALRPARLPDPADWERLAIGWQHSCAQRRDNSAWCWGRNNNSQVGVDGIYRVNTPTLVVGGAPTWSQLAAGGDHTCGIGATGDLFCFGRNDDGELGQGITGDDVETPLPILEPPPNWRDISAGERHTCAVDWDGDAWCWGRNEDGALGVAGEQPVLVPTQVAATAVWTDVESGGDHSCVTDGSGTLSCWGRNEDGELGRGDRSETERDAEVVATSARFSSFSLGQRHTCAVAQGGTLRCWGKNSEAQLGLGDAAARTTPTAVGSASDWLQVSGGRRHTCAVRANGALFCWGDNINGQLGLGDQLQRSLPTQVCVGE